MSRQSSKKTDEKQRPGIVGGLNKIKRLFAKKEVPDSGTHDEKQPDVLPSDNPAIGTWCAVGESLVGLAHRKGTTAIACQDAYCIDTSKRLIAVVCDGAGSSVLSEVGAQQMSQSIVRLFYAIEPLLSILLDSQDDNKLGNRVAEIVYRYSVRLLQDLALNHKRDTRDFRTTLLLIAAGTENIFWYKVGDGTIVTEQNGNLSCVGKVFGGEYHNETDFVDVGLSRGRVQYGLLSGKSVSGLALMSDGVDVKLVSSDKTKVAGRLATFFELLRKSEFHREDLYKFFTDHEVWKGTNHDDKTLVVAVRENTPEVNKP